MFSYLDSYVISRNFSCFLISIVTFVPCAILPLLFHSLRLYLAQLYLFFYLDCYVCISGSYSCPLIWILTFVSRATTAVLLFGLLRLYLAQLKLSSYLDCYVCILHNSISRNESLFLISIVTFLSLAISAVFFFSIWIVMFVSCTILAVFLFGLLRLYLSQFKLFSYLD